MDVRLTEKRTKGVAPSVAEVHVGLTLISIEGARWLRLKVKVRERMFSIVTVRWF
jgi:hypothetical protein